VPALLPHPRRWSGHGTPVKAAIDDPRRFVKSKTVGAHFGLTSRRIQTGDSIDIEGRISKCGDGEVRTVLYEAASAMLVRSKQWCSVKAWGGGGSRPSAATNARSSRWRVSWPWSCIGCGWTAASFVLLQPMGVRIALELAKRRRSPPLVEALASAVSLTG